MRRGECYLLIISLCIFIVNNVQGEYRLPKTLYPDKYIIELSLEEEAFTNSSDDFSGIVQIIGTVKEDTKRLKLHTSSSININQLLVNNEKISTSNYTANITTEILTVNLASDLKSESAFNITIFYDGRLADDMYGFYKSSYKEGSETKFLATTQFEATYARRAFPCFDEPEFKAKFSIKITHPQTLNALSNTPVQQAATRDNRVITQFEESPIMSTYLVAFIVSEFTCSSSGTGSTSVPHSVCSRKGFESERDWAVTDGPKLLNALNEYTGFDYNNSIIKMEQVAIPDFSAGAMENWGLVTYRETGLLWSETESSNRDKQSISAVIAHEFTHMWFGNLVTTRWWDTIFLNEGFARLFQFLITGVVHPDWEMEKQFVIEHHQTTLALDDVQTAQALIEYAETPSAISDRFGTISYSKGASILRMVQHFLGHQNFRNALKDYLQDRKYNYSEPSMLWTHFNNHATDTGIQTPIKTIMQTWTEVNGYPLVTVSLKDGIVTLTQERFLKSGSEEIPRKWYIPISYTLSNETSKFESTKPRVWLTPEEDKEIDIGNASWIIINNQESAFYRANYDSNLWHQIAHALSATNFSGIPELNRAQIADDIFNIAKVGKLTYSSAFHYLEYLANDTSYYTWYAALNGFSYLERRVGRSTELGQAISKHIVNWMTKVYDTVDGLNNDDQIYTHKLVLTNTWACKLKMAKCVDYVLTEYKNYISTNKKPDPNMRSIIYCNALRYSNQTEVDWNFLWEAYSKATIATEKTTILSALGCTEDVSLLKRYLEYSVDESKGIRSQDALSVFSAVYANPVGVDVAFEFLRHNYTVIKDSYKSLNALGKLITGLADRFTTQNQLTVLRDFIKSLDDNTHGDFKKSAENALTSATANIEWVEKLSSDLYSYYGIEDGNSSSKHFISFYVLVLSVISLLFFK